jgi:hypothetical protein
MNTTTKIYILTVWFIFVPTIIHASDPVPGRPISPHLIGTNLWYGDPVDRVWEFTRDAQVRIIRIGGHAYDDAPPAAETLLRWVKKIRAYGAEPLIQVSQYQPPEQAAATVRFFNVEMATGEPIRYWNIGNEPWIQNGRPSPALMAGQIVSYFKPIAEAMKAVDSSILIYGPDEAYFMDPAYDSLFGGEFDISGKVPGKDYYYCDGLSWHRYPQTDTEPSVAEIEDFRRGMAKARQAVDRANALHGREGTEALGWALGEFNAKNGRLVHTFGNGQMFGGVYGYAMEYGATYVASWSMFENSGSRQGSDYSAFDGQGFTPRASYWHQRMIAENFAGRSVATTSPRADIMVFAAHDPARNSTAIMIMNLGRSPRVPYTLHFDRSGEAAPDGVNLTIDVGLGLSYTDSIAAVSTQVLVFSGEGSKKTTYGEADFLAGRGPQTIAIPDEAGAPVVQVEPPSQPLIRGSAVTLRSQVLGFGPISAQWIALDGQPLPEITDALTLELAPFSLNHFGRYQLQVAGSGGIARSEIITLDPNEYLPYLGNFSCRGVSADKDDVLTAGMVVRSKDLIGMDLLLRGIGPGMATYGVPQYVNDPTLTVLDSTGSIIGRNDNWSDQFGWQNIRNNAAVLGAFPLAEGGLDAAIQRPLPSGGFTLQLDAGDRGGANGLIEVYRVTSPLDKNQGDEMINLSMRADTGGTTQPATLGFVVVDPLGFGRPVRLLMRAVGPGLAAFGIEGSLREPILIVRDADGVEIARNDNWSVTSPGLLLAEQTQAVGAFPLAPGSADAALVYDVPAGVYTVSTESLGDQAGIVLLEVYVVPTAPVQSL